MVKDLRDAVSKVRAMTAHDGFPEVKSQVAREC